MRSVLYHAPHQPRRRNGFSLLELIVVIAVITILMSLLMPAIGQARRTSYRVTCMNNMRNIGFGLIQFDHLNGRLPASGNFGHDAAGVSHPFHNWAVSILPFIEQKNLYDRLDLDLPVIDPANTELLDAEVPVYVCPSDLSRNKQRKRDLSYVVNGGIGFTVRHSNGVRDCPVSRDWTPLDLNGDGQACSGAHLLDDLDRKLFKHLCLFFIETWNTDITKRHHSVPDIYDGSSQTFLLTENVRVGFDPNDATVNLSNSFPERAAFYIGNPCPGNSCAPGLVNYAVCNQNLGRINSGLQLPEGSSSAPNSFHGQGVNVVFADGHVKFLSENINGAVYAALSSPQGALIIQSPLAQVVLPGEGF